MKPVHRYEAIFRERNEGKIKLNRSVACRVGVSSHLLCPSVASHDRHGCRARDQRLAGQAFLSGGSRFLSPLCIVGE